MQKELASFFLSAGLGTRLRPFSTVLAKPAIPFLGLPQILYPYFFCKELKISNISYNTHHLPETIVKVFRNFQIPAKQFHETTILNSGGGIFNAKEDLNSFNNFLVLNADSLFIYENIIEFKNIIDSHIKENRLATLITLPKKGCGINFPGLHSDASGQLVSAGLLENSNLICSHFVGIYIFSNRIFEYMTAEALNIIYDILIKIKEKNPAENIHVQILQDLKWFELGTIKDFKFSHLELSSKKELGDNSFTRTHHYFQNKFPELYPYNSPLEQDILRSL